MVIREVIKARCTTYKDVANQIIEIKKGIECMSSDENDNSEAYIEEEIDEEEMSDAQPQE